MTLELDEKFKTLKELLLEKLKATQEFHEAEKTRLQAEKKNSEILEEL